MGSILTNRWVRVQGVATVLYVFSQIDKANIAVAYPGIGADLGMTAAAIGFATGMFAWGYLALQIPVGRLTSAWSAKRTILVLCAAWSVVSASTALIENETELVINRLMLGMSEGGILPAVVVVMRAWFTQRERARANLALLGTPIALAVGNAVCGFAVSLVGWRLMFVVTAVPSLLWCLVWWWAVEDDPREARWLDPAVKAKLAAELTAEAKTEPVERDHWLRTMWHPTVLILAFYNLLGLTALWGLTFWLPTLIVEQGRKIGMAGLLAATPYVVAVVITYFISASSDRRQERRWHLIVPTVLAGVFMIAGGLIGETHVALLLVCASLTFGLWFGRITVYWIMVADAVPKGCAGPSMAVANGFGNLGGFLGPWIFGLLRGYSGGFDSAMILGGALYVAAGLLAVTVQARPSAPTEALPQARPLVHRPAPSN